MSCKGRRPIWVLFTIPAFLTSPSPACFILGCLIVVSERFALYRVFHTPVLGQLSGWHRSMEVLASTICMIGLLAYLTAVSAHDKKRMSCRMSASEPVRVCIEWNCLSSCLHGSIALRNLFVCINNCVLACMTVFLCCASIPCMHPATRLSACWAPWGLTLPANFLAGCAHATRAALKLPFPMPVNRSVCNCCILPKHCQIVRQL